MKVSPASVAAAAAAAVPPGRAVVALGGGADSASAAWALVNRADSAEVRAVFVAHGWEGSADLEAAAGQLARRVEIDLTVVEALVDQRASSPEDTARRARERVFAGELALGEWLVTGHTSDDLAETVLANLLRGAGTTGMAGIPPRRGAVVRPLLGFSRQELRAVANELNLPYADDPANHDRRFLRSRLRHDLIPLLEAEYSPAIRTLLARTAAHARDDEEALAALGSTVPMHLDAGAALLPIPVLTTVPRAIAARAVRRALRSLLDPYPGTAADVAAVLDVAFETHRRASLSSDLLAVREDPFVAIHRPSDSAPAPAAVSVPGEVRFGVHTVRFENAIDPARIGARGSMIGRTVLGDEVVVRTALLGERIGIGTGSKPVREALAEGGVPERLRPAWPVVVVGGKIAAVAGVRVAPWARPAGEDMMLLSDEREKR